MAESKTEHGLRILTAEIVDEQISGVVRCPVCGRVGDELNFYGYCCEGTNEELQVCDSCVSDFETDELSLPDTDRLDPVLFDRLWKYMQVAKNEGEPWERNDRLFHELHTLLNHTGASSVVARLEADMVTLIVDGDQRHTFTMNGIRHYRGDSLQDLILPKFEKVH